MPNRKAQEKHLKQTKKRTERNSLVKRSIKEIIKSGQKAVAAGEIDKKAGELTHKLQKTVDKAVRAGILKANTADRKKVRFAKMIKKSGAKPTPAVSQKNEEKK
ncbi:30S ribosomal protein S20 [Patescibacteria group bacterium]|nr:30S ribosomal protein S20 [Patescibacteria group bacterium]